MYNEISSLNSPLLLNQVNLKYGQAMNNYNRFNINNIKENASTATEY